MTTRNLLLFPAAFALLALTCARAADAGYTLGVPGAPTLRMSADAGDNAWLSANPNYPAMAIVAPGGADATSSERRPAPTR